MEKENKKAREDARREYNDTVRVGRSLGNGIVTLTFEQSLVLFVRKRDPRYRAHLKAQSQPLAPSPGANPRAPQTKTGPAAVYIEQEWQRTSISGTEDLQWALAEGNDNPEVFECVACGKSFKSEAAWNSHERSKKHIKNVETLRRQMEEEATELGLSDPSDEFGPEPTGPCAWMDRGETQVRSPLEVPGGSVTLPLDDGSGTEHEAPHNTQKSPESRAQTTLVDETLPEAINETEQNLSQPEQKPSKRDKRRLREAKKQAQAVEDTQVSV
jgi:DnaJ family protein A protein 5